VHYIVSTPCEKEKTSDGAWMLLSTTAWVSVMSVGDSMHEVRRQRMHGHQFAARFLVGRGRRCWCQLVSTLKADNTLNITYAYRLLMIILCRNFKVSVKNISALMWENIIFWFKWRHACTLSEILTRNSFLDNVVQNLSKSLKICKSYYEKFTATFYGSQYWQEASRPRPTRKIFTSASARCISDKRVQLCATSYVAFSRATFPSLIVCLYLAHSKLSHGHTAL